MKKILLVLPDLDCGGAQRVMLTLLSEFDKGDYKVSLLVLRGGGIMKDNVPEGIAVHYVTMHRCNSFLLALASVLSISRYLLKNRPDAILASVTGANLATLIACQMVRYKRRVVVRHENSGGALHGRFKKKALKLFYKGASRIVTISSDAKDDLIELCPALYNRISVVYNPVSVESIFQQAQSPPPHEWLCDEKVPVVLAVGRLEDPKDYGTLLLAFREVRRCIAARLVVLGEGSLRQSLEKMLVELKLEQDVLLAGCVANPYAWIKHSDLFVMSSKSEGQPVAMIEALVLGAEIVATDCRSGPRELLDNGKYGSLVPVGDYERLAEEIIAGLGSEGRNVQAIKARGAEFSPDKAVASHLKLLFE